MANDDVLIVGKLDDKDLLDSIDNLIKEVSDKSQVMANKFEKSMNIMKDAMKDFAVTQKVSVDLMKESWREMSASFDAMFKAASDGSGGGKGSGKGRYDDGTLGQFREETKELERQREDLKLNSDELREQNRIIAERRRMLKDQTTDLATLRLDRTMRMPSGDLDEASRKLRMLEAIQRRYAGTTELSEQQQKKLADAIARCKHEIDRFNSTKPKSLKDVLGMDESTLDAIAKKMRALRTVSIDPNNKQQVHDLGNEYSRLSRLQAELMGKGIQLTHANNYLAQSFGYIRNRIVYALTLGAVTNFTKQIYEVRGQYELLERSLGILIDDMRRGSELFNELNAMALKSPFTLMELATGAKQLLAYNFAEEEVVDTTRRLADISSALGVPMERLVYNLGQIRAQTALTARDARDFANAGLAIVPMLAQMYTEEKRFGDEIVTTAQVFDMMSKKMVSYADVMKVINRVTDEGGKFFDFQAKQAETLRVKMANLTLAWNNMLNEIGSENQSILELPLKGLKALFENWRALAKAVNLVVVAFGAYKAAAMLVALWNARLLIAGEIKAFIDLAKSVKTAGEAMALFNVYCKANPIGLVVSALAAAVGYFYLFNDAVSDAGGYTEKFGNAGAKALNDVESLFDTLKGISSESSNYKKVMGELNSILEEYDLETVKETDSMDVLNEKRRAAIALIKEEALERKHLNDVQQGNDQYESSIKNAREKMRAQLKEAMSPNAVGLLSENDDLRKNADAIANIISDVVERNVSLIAGKTGDEYEKGVNKIYDIIHERMRAIGLDEGTISNQWLDNSLFLHEDIVGSFVASMKEAKEAREDYTTAIDNAYETEKKAIENSASFNERVEQTQTRLMKAANDTDNFAKKVEQLLKQYGGENIIDFLVKVRTEVPAWMNQKGLTELTQLSARFTALATNAKKAGKTALNVNGTEFSIEQLFQRAAQYTQAAQNKAADIEARKSSTITREASDALKQYKSALEAVNVAKNKFKRGTADQALVTEKETEAQNAYNKALEKGVSLDELRKAKNGWKSGSGSKKDPLGDALTKEIQLISDIQKMYKDYQKAGVDADTARIASAKEYEKTLKTTNNTLSRYGIKGLSGEELATMDLRSLRDFYEKLRKAAEDKGNIKGVEALEKAIRSLNTEITKVDYKIIIDGLNNELGKIKDDYELAVELDANPELGNMFAEMFNIDTSTLPRTFNQALAKVQESVDNALGKIGVKQPFDVLKGDVDAFAKAVGQSLDGETIKGLKNAQNYIRGLWKRNIEETSGDWNTLIEKYGGLQAKILKIYKDGAAQQASIVKQFGTDEQQTLALDLLKNIKISQDPAQIARLQEELAKVEKDIIDNNPIALKIYQATQKEQKSNESKAYWEDFKESDLYTMTFEDMSRNSTRAIQLIIEKLTELKDKVKEDPASMKALMKSLQDANNELEGRSSTTTIGNAMKEYSAATKEVVDAKKELAAADTEVSGSERALDLAKTVGDTQSVANATERLEKARERQKEATVNLTKAENKQKASVEKLKSGMQTLSSELQNVQGLFSTVSKLFRAAGDDDTADAIDAINEGFSVMTTVIMGVMAALVLLESSNPWLLAIAAALSVIVGLVSFLSGNSNKNITKQVEESERAVKRLENAYKRLEFAADQAYGTAVAGANQAMKANKELQLVELKRQLALEQSRSSKNKDEDKIIQLSGDIIELEQEIAKATQDTLNGLLGISSHGEFFEDMISDMISAFKNGEDAMAVFEEKWAGMIDNMVMKTIVSQVLTNWIESLENGANEILERFTSEPSQKVSDLTSKMTDLYTKDAGDIAEWLYDNQRETFNNILNSLGMDSVGDMYAVDRATFFGSLWNTGLAKRIADVYKSMLNSQMGDLNKQLDKASLDATGDLIDYYSQAGEDFKENYLGLILDKIKENWTFGQDNEKQLSQLQQGIQGITEDTAGSLEAYMNGVSQQVYLQSELITEIRDAVVGFDLDVQLGMMSQMLLQLQQSYQVQLAIQNIISGWSNPSGMAVRVEMI